MNESIGLWQMIDPTWTEYKHTAIHIHDYDMIERLMKERRDMYRTGKLEYVFGMRDAQRSSNEQKDITHSWKQPYMLTVRRAKQYGKRLEQQELKHWRDTDEHVGVLVQVTPDTLEWQPWKNWY